MSEVLIFSSNSQQESILHVFAEMLTYTFKLLHQTKVCSNKGSKSFTFAVLNAVSSSFGGKIRTGSGVLEYGTNRKSTENPEGERLTTKYSPSLFDLINFEAETPQQ